MKKDTRGVLEYGPVSTPGLYTLAPPVGLPVHYVFNADRKESDTTKLSEAEIAGLAKAHGIPVVRSLAEYQKLEHKQRFGTEMWKWALWALLVLIFLELILQHRFASGRGNGAMPAKEKPQAEMAAR